MRALTRQYYLYILASRPGGALYVGVTNDLVRRVYEHKMKLVHGHTKRYQIDQLVYFEVYDSPFNSDPTRKEHEALAARVEDKADRRNESNLA
jgi:predicted GIY-YIG superfamily endonuclease